ncbi:Wadjet anti-phage system protein JetD domain-containing protein [Aeoliella sp.]|uniref:Wadjet anti-phage system protein JetD domain-containing protein n=1 Tax=Aeoliella sp. TaxID=2795800 RepID=UPI003CCC30B7
MITPAEIKKRARTCYDNYVSGWLAGEEDPFPIRVRANLQLRDKNIAADIRDIEALRRKSKAKTSWGYRVEEQQVDSPIHGSNIRPVGIWIDTLEDLLRMTGKLNEFQRMKKMVEKLRRELPELEPWIQSSHRQLPEEWWTLNGAIQVAKFLIANPRPDCYPQQLPVEVDTKFISRHETLLRGWLDLLLPASAIDVNEPRFAPRYGLRDALQPREVVFLDPTLQSETGLPFDEFAATVRSLAELQLKNAVVVIVENKAPLTCVPPLPRGLVIAGQGTSVHMLKDLPWLADNRVLYWGDIDAAGFEILSDFRKRVPHAESILMDATTYETHRKYVQKCKSPPERALPHLNEEEWQMYCHCAEKQMRLEQEKLAQKYVCDAFLRAATPTESDAESPDVETDLPNAG